MYLEALHRCLFGWFLILPILLLPFQCSQVMLDRWRLGTLQHKYSYFPESLRLRMMNETKKMFYFGYNNYMNLAFPLDELNPLLCKGRGPDYENP